MSIEKTLERRLVKDVKDFGGYCLKFLPWLETGIPDRICILPNGVTIYVELKSGGTGVLKGKQLVWKKRLAKLGHKHYVVFDEKSYGNFLKTLYVLRLKQTK